METINNLVLIAISIVAVISLVREIEPGVETSREILMKLLFGSIAVGALFGALYSKTEYYLLMNISFLIILLERLYKLRQKRRLKKQGHENKQNRD